MGRVPVTCFVLCWTTLTSKLGSKVAISDFVFHYILAKSEPLLPRRENVWSAIVRPFAPPTVTDLPGIRSSFCFRAADANVLAYRELSCRCRCCLEHRWNECNSVNAGAWKRVSMRYTAASAVARTRGQRSQISQKRQKLAQAVQADEIIAMESANDSEGFRFWLARAEGPATKYQGDRIHSRGLFRTLPLELSLHFQLGQERYLECRGCDFTQVSVQPDLVQRSLRSVSTVRRVISLDPEEIERLNDLPSLDSLST